MWTTSFNDAYVLKGDQARFYINLTQLLVNFLVEFDPEIDEPDEIAPTGCVLFDHTSVKQKIYLLSICLEALLEPNVEPPKPNHLIQAAAYFPFAFLEEQVRDEIEREQLDGNQVQDEEERFYARYYRLQTFHQYQQSRLPQIDRELAAEENSDPEPLQLESQDIEEWRHIINFLAHELVLGDDEDFKLTGYFPQIFDDTGSIKSNLGIEENYFQLQLPSVTEEDYKQALARIERYPMK